MWCRATLKQWSKLAEVGSLLKTSRETAATFWWNIVPASDRRVNRILSHCISDDDKAGAMLRCMLSGSPGDEMLEHDLPSPDGYGARASDKVDQLRDFRQQFIERGNSQRG